MISVNIIGKVISDKSLAYLNVLSNPPLFFGRIILFSFIEISLLYIMLN